MISLLLLFIGLINLSYGQGDICETLRGLNTTRLRSRVNNSDGSIVAYSDLSLFLENGSFIEINLQNPNEAAREGVYRITEEKGEETICILEREIRGTSNNYTDCETLTITAKSNSAEGAEGCTVGNITSPNDCLRTCRNGDTIVTDDLVAYIINGKIQQDKIPKIKSAPYKF